MILYFIKRWHNSIYYYLKCLNSSSKKPVARYVAFYKLVIYLQDTKNKCWFDSIIIWTFFSALLQMLMAVLSPPPCLSFYAWRTDTIFIKL